MGLLTLGTDHSQPPSAMVSGSARVPGCLAAVRIAQGRRQYDWPTWGWRRLRLIEPGSSTSLTVTFDYASRRGLGRRDPGLGSQHLRDALTSSRCKRCCRATSLAASPKDLIGEFQGHVSGSLSASPGHLEVGRLLEGQHAARDVEVGRSRSPRRSQSISLNPRGPSR